MRILRLVRFFRPLRVLALSIFSTLKTLIWALFLICIIIYMVGIVFAQAAIDPSLAHKLGPASRAEIHRIYGTVPRAMFSLFKATTGGVDWGELVYPLASISGFYVVLFLVFMSFIQFAVMNVVTGHFCQNAIESAQKNQELVIQEHISKKSSYAAKLQKLFNSIDVHCSGAITLVDLEQALANIQIRGFLESLEIDAADPWEIFSLLDSTGNHAVNLEDFVCGCLRLRGQATSLELAKLVRQVDWVSSTLAAHIEGFQGSNIVEPGACQGFGKMAEDYVRTSVRANL